ncbi:hypothetical protein F5B19DRAFT_469871 [Rostrohypoxylon terebratum]|nr:hypothetical protein F5B19DRAFT_469871 [Rostrohypoxylon terebratum]
MGYYDENGTYFSFRNGSRAATSGQQEKEGIGDKEETVHPMHSIQMASVPPSIPAITIPCHHVRMGDILLLKGRPCQVIRISTNPQTGQFKYLGVDLFTKKLHEEISFTSSPSSNTVVQTVFGPIFHQYLVLDIEDDTIVAMTETGDIKTGLPVIDQSNLLSRLYEAFDSHEGSVRVLVLKDEGRELAVDMKVVPAALLDPINTPANDHHTSDPGANEKPPNVKLFAFKYLPKSTTPSTPERIEKTVIEDVAQSFSISQYNVCLTENCSEERRKRSILKVLNNTNDHISTLYHWIHLKPLAGPRSHVMRFGEFTREAEKKARELLDWSPAELRALSAVIQHVGKEFVKPGGSSKTNTQLMRPSFHAETAFQRDLAGNNVPSSKTVSWICLPYICLKEYMVEPSDLPQDSYPIRSLMHGSFPNHRDLNQAVCSSPETAENHCYHIAQMWCLILDNSLIITYSTFSVDSLRLIEVNQMPEPSGDRPGEIIVSFSKSIKWLLPISACKTWFAFTTHFLEFWPRHMEFC